MPIWRSDNQGIRKRPSPVLGMHGKKLAGSFFIDAPTNHNPVHWNEILWCECSLSGWRSEHCNACLQMLTCLVHAIYLPEPFNHEEVYQHPPRLEMNIFILKCNVKPWQAHALIRPQLLRTGIDVVHCPELVFLFLSNIPAFVRNRG
jgi:hypothetical protein